MVYLSLISSDDSVLADITVYTVEFFILGMLKLLKFHRHATSNFVEF